jgi:hypothetical protein
MSAKSFEPAFYLGPVLFVMADHMTGAKPLMSEEATTLPTLRATEAHRGMTIALIAVGGCLNEAPQ